MAVAALGSPTERNDLRDIYVRTQSGEDGVGDAAVHGEFDVKSDSCAISGKRPFDAPTGSCADLTVPRNAKLHRDLAGH